MVPVAASVVAVGTVPPCKGTACGPGWPRWWRSGADPALREDVVDLPDCLLEAFLHAHPEQLLHGGHVREPAQDRHPRPSATDRLDRHLDVVERQLGIGRAVSVREPV